ncbi:MAG: dynamin family protein [Comamonadaceae bacterium]|nr:dynamin family protein [Comamonadaceae bacterium]
MELESKCLPISGAKELVGRVNIAASRFHIVSLHRQIQVCESLLEKTHLIDVAILGQFKAGKSSFINSLVGREILPVGVIPVTTVITRLQYGPQERSIITYIDGTRAEIGIEELGEFISEAQNPSNSKNVDIVDIELPALEAYPGLRLVDTPGLGSVFTYHKEVSENWLPEVGAAVLGHQLRPPALRARPQPHRRPLPSYPHDHHPPHQGRPFDPGSAKRGGAILPADVKAQVEP